MRRGIWLIGPLWAIGISAYIMFAPMVKSVSLSRSLSPDHRSIQTAPDYSRMSWHETKGLSAARLLVIPILLAFLPFVIPNIKTRSIAGAISIVLLVAFCALTAFSVGSYYMPSVVALLAALFVEYYYEKKAKQVDGKANHI